MAEVEIYTSQWCGFCHMAKRLLGKKGIDYTEFDVTEPGRREEMMQRSNGGYTVPQIFIDGRHIGGCNELHGLERAGKLDSLLAGAS